MPERAHVTSVEALEEFRATLIVYLTKARPTLEEVSGDVMRTRLWLENEQRVHWEAQVRRRTKELEEAQAALFQAQKLEAVGLLAALCSCATANSATNGCTTSPTTSSAANYGTPSRPMKRSWC